jgi:hypothetical protein
MALADEAGRQACHILAPTLMPTVDTGLRTIDGMSKQYLGYDTRLYYSSRNIWS